MSQTSAPAAAPTTAPEDRVPIAQKIAYGLGTGNDMWGHWLLFTVAFPVFNIYLHVSPVLIGWALFLNRIFDAFSDPFFGWLSDNARTRFGRRRPFILIGGILAGLAYPILYSVSPGWSEWQLFWYMIGSAAIYIPLMSSFNMPYQSLANEMTPDYNERSRLMAYKGAIQKIAEVGNFSAMAFTSLVWFRDPATGQADTLRGIQVYSYIIGGIMVLTSIVIFFTVKERYYDNLVTRKQAKTRLLESFLQALKCQPFRLHLMTTLGFAMGTSMVGALGYYATVYYVCGGDQNVGNVWNFWMGISGLVGGFLGAPFFAWVANRHGKVTAWKAILITGFAVFITTWFTYTPSITWLQLFASGPIAFAQAGFWMVMGSTLADVMDFDELQSGQRREGAFASCNSWMIKFGLALGSLASGSIIAYTGFNDRIAVQSEQTIWMIRFLLAAIPLAGIALSYAFVLRYPLGPREMSEIRTQLEARRGKV